MFVKFLSYQTREKKEKIEKNVIFFYFIKCENHSVVQWYKYILVIFNVDYIFFFSSFQ